MHNGRSFMACLHVAEKDPKNDVTSIIRQPQHLPPNNPPSPPARRHTTGTQYDIYYSREGSCSSTIIPAPYRSTWHRRQYRRYRTLCRDKQYEWLFSPFQLSSEIDVFHSKVPRWLSPELNIVHRRYDEHT